MSKQKIYTVLDVFGQDQDFGAETFIFAKVKDAVAFAKNRFSSYKDECGVRNREVEEIEMKDNSTYYSAYLEGITEITVTWDTVR